MVSILVVCVANICRSPAAEAVLQHLNQQRPHPLDLHIESCGLGEWHLGHLPSEQMRLAVEERGMSLTKRAKKFQSEYFYSFDYIFAVDEDVLHQLYNMATKLEHRAKIHLITEYSQAYARQNIPDPFTQPGAAFEIVLDMLEDACHGALEHIARQAK